MDIKLAKPDTFHEVGI